MADLVHTTNTVTRREILWTTATLALPALLLASSPLVSAAAAFDRAAVTGGELWRVVTGHWTHWSADHLRWDLIAFVVLLPLCLHVGRKRTWLALGAAVLLIPLTVWFALPEMTFYRGLSGLDSALFTLLAASLWLQTRRGLFGLALAAFVAKVLFELISGAAVFVDNVTFVPVPLAHAVGGACGLVAAAWPRLHWSPTRGRSRPAGGDHDDHDRPNHAA